MPKVTSFTTDKIKKGIDTTIDVMKITIGPRGKNVSLSNGEIVNDGGRIANDIQLKDHTENKGADSVRLLVRKTSEEVGGGRTATGIIYQELTTEGLKLINKGSNVNLLKQGMKAAVENITKNLEENAQKVKGVKDLEKVARISTEDESLGTVIAETIDKIGADGIFTVEESNTFGVSAVIEEGLKCNQGYVSPYMVTNDRMEAEYTDIPVFIADKKISFFKEIKDILETLTKENKNSLLVIADDFEGEALNISVLAKLKGHFNLLAIKTPGVGDMKSFTREDLAALTGAEVGTELNKFQVKLGSAKKVIARKDHTVIIGSGDIKTWITTLKTRSELSENKWEKDQYAERIAKLQNGIAVFKVGSSSEKEVKYLKLKIEDGANETKRALEEGIVCGGDVAFINASKTLKTAPGHDEYAQGYNLVLQAIEAPLRQIIVNADGREQVVINTIKSSESATIGYNALTNEIVEDMFKEGIIDALKVSKTVLRNAVTEASIFLSIGGDISEIIEEK